MGAWGFKPLENDDAADLSAEFADSKDISILERAIDQIVNLGEKEYLEAPEASMAIASASIIRTIPNLPKELIEKSKKAVTRVLENSELKELWEESEEYDKWHSATKELIE